MSSRHPSVYHRQQPDYISLRGSTSGLNSQRPHVDPIIDRLEQAQSEVTRLKKAYDDIVEKRNHLKVECRMGIQAMCVAGRRNEILQNQLSNIMQNSNAKEISQLQSERDAAVHDYNLVMQERDTVHKEIERLQEDLSESQRTCSILETEKRMSASEIESLKEKLDITIKERNRLAGNCQDLRDQVNNLMSIISSNTPACNYQNSPQQVAGHMGSMHRNFHTACSSTLNDSLYRYYTSSTSNYGIRLSNCSPGGLTSISKSRSNNHTWQPTKDNVLSSAHLDCADRSSIVPSDDGNAILKSGNLLNSTYDNHRLASHQTSLYQEGPYSSRFSGSNVEFSKLQSQSPYSSLCTYDGNSRSSATPLADTVGHLRLGATSGTNDKGLGNNAQQPYNQGNASREMRMLITRIDDLTYKLTEAQCDARSLAKNREQVIVERDKLVSERNSIRLLCDRLRRERDGAVSKLAEALHDSNNFKLLMAEQRVEMKELRHLQEHYDVKHDRDALGYSSTSMITHKGCSDYHSNQLQPKSNNMHYHNQCHAAPKNCKLFASQQILNNNNLTSMLGQTNLFGISVNSDSNSYDIVSSSTNSMNTTSNQGQQQKSVYTNSNSNFTTNHAITSNQNTPTKTVDCNYNNHNRSNKQKSQTNNNHDSSKSDLLTLPESKNSELKTNRSSQSSSSKLPSTQEVSSSSTLAQANTTVQCKTSLESAVDADFSFELLVLRPNDIVKKTTLDPTIDKDQQTNSSNDLNISVSTSNRPNNLTSNNSTNYQESVSSSEQISSDQNNSENSLIKYGFDISDRSELGKLLILTHPHLLIYLTVTTIN